MKLSGLTKMVKRQLVCNVFHNDESDDFYIGTASAIYCATGFPRPLNRNQMGAMLGISEDTMIEKVVYNDFDCAYKIDFQGFNLDDTIKDEVEVKKLGILISWGGDDVARDSGAGLLLDVPPVTGGNLVYFLVECGHVLDLLLIF